MEMPHSWVDLSLSAWLTIYTYYYSMDSMAGCILGKIWVIFIAHIRYIFCSVRLELKLERLGWHDGSNPSLFNFFLPKFRSTLGRPKTTCTVEVEGIAKNDLFTSYLARGFWLEFNYF